VDSVRYHLILYISKLETSKKMYDALANLFIVSNIGQVMSLKNELRDVKITNYDTVSSYFIRISQVRDQLQAIDEVISEKELVTTILNGLPRSWEAFATSISSRKEVPSFEDLWTSCAKEESRLISRDRKEEDS